jgi:hypothetical protein
MPTAKRSRSSSVAVTIVIFLSFALACPSCSQNNETPGLDSRVSRFLDDTRRSWSDANVPYKDGKILHDLVAKGGFKNILEIGTSTGHSTIWLASAACFTAHNVRWKTDPGILNFIAYVEKEPRFQTTIKRGSGEGISISCKIKE